MTFAPASQNPNQGPWTQIMIHSNMTPAAVIAAIKRKIGGKHPDVVTEFGDFQKQIRGGMAQERLMALLSGFFGLLTAALRDE